MTEKRFTLCEVDLYEYGVPLNEIMDNGVPISQGKVIDLLNKLNEENEVLKKVISRYMDDIEKLIIENEKLKRTCKNYMWYKQYKQLLNENEQLKQQIKDLRLNVLDSIHEADEIQCTCNPCVVEKYVKKVVE